MVEWTGTCIFPINLSGQQNSIHQLRAWRWLHITKSCTFLYGCVLFKWDWIKCLTLSLLSLVYCRSLFYKCPSFYPHIPRPLEGVVQPQKVCIRLFLSYLPPNSTAHNGLFGKVFDNRTIIEHSFYEQFSIFCKVEVWEFGAFSILLRLPNNFFL